MRSPLGERFRRNANILAPAPRQPIGGYDVDTLAQLRREFVATLDMSKVIPDEIQRRATAMSDELAKAPRDGKARVPLDMVVDDLEVWRWGLSDSNLDLCEWYLGGPVRYLGVNVRREFADGRWVHVRQWHMDIEDRNTMKIIVYLSDVDGGSGPFEYLSRDATKRAVKALRYSSGRVDDDRMADVVDRSDWRTVNRPTIHRCPRRSVEPLPPGQAADDDRPVLDDVFILLEHVPTRCSLSICLTAAKLACFGANSSPVNSLRHISVVQGEHRPRPRARPSRHTVRERRPPLGTIGPPSPPATITSGLIRPDDDPRHSFSAAPRH